MEKPAMPLDSPDLQDEVANIIVSRRPDLKGKSIEEVRAVLAEEIAAKAKRSTKRTGD